MSECVRVLSAVGASRDIYLPTYLLSAVGASGDIHIPSYLKSKYRYLSVSANHHVSILSCFVWLVGTSTTESTFE